MGAVGQEVAHPHDRSGAVAPGFLDDKHIRPFALDEPAQANRVDKPVGDIEGDDLDPLKAYCLLR